MIFGEFDPLVCHHTGGTQVLGAVHTKPHRFSVVIAGHADLRKGAEKNHIQIPDKLASKMLHYYGEQE